MQPKDIKECQYYLSEYEDQQAFEKLYVHFYKNLMSFAISFTREEPAAEEIVEDVFVKLWERRRMASSIRDLKVYLFVAVRNRALNYIQWKSRNLISFFEYFPENIQVCQNTPESLLMTREMALRIDQAIEELPPKCKMIFKLVREEQLKYREVAEILDISPRTVDTQMTIAMKKLKAAVILYTSSSI